MKKIVYITIFIFIMIISHSETEIIYDVYFEHDGKGCESLNFEKIDNIWEMEDEWIRLSKLGNTESTYSLGYLYKSQGRDESVFLPLLIKAAEDGYLLAIQDLGYFYAYKEDYILAEKYLLYAAEKNCVRSMYSLAQVYDEIDEEKAEYYYNKAYLNGARKIKIEIKR